MSRYIFRLRRGWKDDSTGRNDWVEYEENGGVIPQPGELVLEYDNGIPRLKIGDGIHTFAQLEYMSVDSFILPKQSVKIDLSSQWTAVEGVSDTYEQDITSQLTDLITNCSKIDLQPTPNQLCAFHEKNVAFTTINENGIVKVYAVGTKPETDYVDIPITITEVICEGEEKIIGDTATTPNPQPDLSLYATQEWVKEYVGSVTPNITFETTENESGGLTYNITSQVST